jgi:hypothetical protein
MDAERRARVVALTRELGLGGLDGRELRGRVRRAVRRGKVTHGEALDLYLARLLPEEDAGPPRETGQDRKPAPTAAERLLAFVREHRRRLDRAR